MNSQQQNKWYPQRCLLAHFEATFDFSRSTFGGTIYFAVDYIYKKRVFLLSKIFFGVYNPILKSVFSVALSF